MNEKFHEILRNLLNKENFIKTNKQQIVLGLIKTLEGSIKPVNSETRTINIVVYIGIDKPTATSLVKHDST